MKNHPINIEKIHQLIEERFIMRNKHPEADLWIYNYTALAQYERHWIAETLMCRGLILDANYHIVSRPVSKFFNLQEVGMENLPDLPFTVSEKMDGSLGILYWLEGKPYIASRGSFASKQADFATKLLHCNYAHSIPNLNPNKTYVFEIIYPENRIVVDYKKKEELTLLAIIDTATAEEEELKDIGFALPKVYNQYREISDLTALDWKNHEGFVVKYSDGFRVKIKFDNYLKIHKIVTQLSSLTIWERMMNGSELAPFLAQIPDEFYAWMRSVETKLNAEFKKIEDVAIRDFKVLDTDKETALYYNSCQYPSILFYMWKKRDYQQIIWKRIKPKFEKAYEQ